jgi:hypothetical protein
MYWKLQEQFLTKLKLLPPQHWYCCLCSRPMKYHSTIQTSRI